MVRIAEALVVYDLPRPQELDGLDDIRVVGKAQDVVIAQPGFLFSGQVLVQVGDRVAGDGEGRSGEGRA